MGWTRNILALGLSPAHRFGAEPQARRDADG
jgi:hypothetical protein